MIERPITSLQKTGTRIADIQRSIVVERDQKLDPVEDVSSKLSETVGRMNEFTFSPDLLTEQNVLQVDSDILSQARRLKTFHERSQMGGSSDVPPKLTEYHIGEHIEQALSVRAELQNQLDTERTDRSYEALALKLFSGRSDIMTMLVRQEPRRVMRILKDYGAEPLSEHFAYYADTMEEGMKSVDDRPAFATEFADFCSRTDTYTGYYDNTVIFPLHGERGNHNEKERGERRFRGLVFKNPNEVLKGLSDEDAETVKQAFIRLQDSHAKSFFGVGPHPSHYRRHAGDYKELQRSGLVRDWRNVSKVDGEWKWTRK